MSLVHLANACSHLQNASLARLGLTSLPRTNQLHEVALQLQRSGYINSVTIGGPEPPPPSTLSPVLNHNAGPSGRGGGDISSHVVLPLERERMLNEGRGLEGYGGEGGEEGPAVTQANIASRRIWVGLKYYNNRPVLERMGLVSKPKRRVWMPFRDLECLIRGERMGYVKGIRAIGEAMFVSSDRGIMEIREAVDRRVGGMLLCRINHV